MTGHPADPFSVQLMQERGIDISMHRAQSLASWMVSEADIVIAMDLQQMRFVEAKYPASKGKVFRFHAFGGADVPDPYRQDLAVFRQACSRISNGVDALVERIGRIA